MNKIRSIFKKHGVNMYVSIAGGRVYLTFKDGRRSIMTFEKFKTLINKLKH